MLSYRTERTHANKVSLHLQVWGDAEFRISLHRTFVCLKVKKYCCLHLSTQICNVLTFFTTVLIRLHSTVTAKHFKLTLKLWKFRCCPDDLPVYFFGKTSKCQLGLGAVYLIRDSLTMHWSRYSREREIRFLTILWNTLIKFGDSPRKQMCNRSPVLLSLQSDLEKKILLHPRYGISFNPEQYSPPWHRSYSLFIVTGYKHFLICKCLSKLIRNAEGMEFEIIYDIRIPRSVLCNSEKRMLLYLEILKWWIHQKVRISL